MNNKRHMLWFQWSILMYKKIHIKSSLKPCNRKSVDKKEKNRKGVEKLNVHQLGPAWINYGMIIPRNTIWPFKIRQIYVYWNETIPKLERTTQKKSKADDSVPNIQYAPECGETIN